MRRGLLLSAGLSSLLLALLCLRTQAVSADSIADYLRIVPTAFFFPNFLNRPLLNLNGDASTQLEELVVAGPGFSKTGSAWFATAYDLSKGFFCEFVLSATQVENKGAEGFAFVLQSDGPYATGRGGSGIGYDGIGPGIAVEFDTTHDEGYAKAKDAHVAVRVAKDSGQKLSSDHAVKQGEPAVEKVGKVPDIEKIDLPMQVRVAYEPAQGRLAVHARVYNGKTDYVFVAGAVVGALDLTGPYYVGFTAATGKDSYARFAVKEWRFGANAHQGCAPGFTGEACAVTNEEAARACPRRDTCSMCVQDVYNCAWCGASCVVGVPASLESCPGSAKFDVGECSAGVSLVGLWIMLGIVAIVSIFAGVLVRVLPSSQAFRAVSLLVSLGFGATAGMVLAYVIAASLVEISVTPMFSWAFGLFFLAEGGVVLHQLHARRGVDFFTSLSTCTDYGLLLAGVWVFASGILCFFLDREYFPWLPQTPKVFMYIVLGASLNFCLVFSAHDVLHELYERVASRAGGGAAAVVQDSRSRRDVFGAGSSAAGPGQEFSYGDDAVVSSSRVLTIARSRARVALLLTGSLVAGVYFGLIFGLLRVEESGKYRTAVALRQEAVFTFPAGATIGGIAGLLLQVLQLPDPSDREIDDLIHGAKDDL